MVTVRWSEETVLMMILFDDTWYMFLYRTH